MRVILLGTLLLMARAPDVFEAATTLPQEQAMFAESDAYELFMDAGAAGWRRSS